jgi:hypothetical protein
LRLFINVTGLVLVLLRLSILKVLDGSLLSSRQILMNWRAKKCVTVIVIMIMTLDMAEGTRVNADSRRKKQRR